MRSGRRRIAILAVAALAMGLLPATIAAGDEHRDDDPPTEWSEDLEPGDVNVVPVQVTGPADERLNLIILGDGYQADEMRKFHQDVDRNQNVQWATEPFRSYRNYFNVYLVETPSVDSGISCDPDDGNTERDTVYNLTFSWWGCPADPLARGTYYGSGGSQAREDILDNHVAPELGIDPDAQNVQTLNVFNTFTYGGIGGTHATTSGGSPQGPLISLHELGHSLGNLSDEYPYSSRPNPGGPHGNYEPRSIHHTRMSSEEMLEEEAKWWRWLGEESTAGGEIRAADPDGYESGLYNSSNVWRPSEHSMMRWIGFYLDQVGREHMTVRITGMRDAAEMPLPSTPEGEVGADDVVWVEPMRPRFHELTVTWEINGEEVSGTSNNGFLDLSDHDVAEGDEITVTVADETEFVRDPEYLEGPEMTQTREWTVGEALPATDVDPEITNHAPDVRALAHDEVAWIETDWANDRALDVEWTLNGEVIEGTANGRSVDLAELDVPAGASELTATVTDPTDPQAGSDEVTWTVDNGMPEAPRELSEPLTSLEEGDEHNVYFNEFDMYLDPQDDQPGFVVGELRLNEDGWFNYFGFPEEPHGSPFTFSHSGKEVKALVYGNLGTGGLSKAAFEQEYGPDDPNGPFIPGFGTHKVEHRAIDASGNRGEAEEFNATVLPGESPECDETLTGAQRGGVDVSDGVVCLEGANVRGGVTVSDGATLVASDSTINGGLDASDAEAVQLFGTTVNGSSEITGTASDVTIAGSSFDGGLTLSGNNQESVNEQYGEYGPILVGSSVNGNLECHGNNEEVDDFGASNDVSGASRGDCAGL